MERNLKKIGIKKGFTLIELLLTIVILSILLTIIILAINPSKQIVQTNDAVRSADIRNIGLAVQTYIIDNKGSLPSGLSSEEKQLGNSVSGCVNLNRGCNVVQNSCLDLSSQLVDYLKIFPKDPKVGNSAKTNYSISVNSKNVVTVKACGAEGANEIIISL